MFSRPSLLDRGGMTVLSTVLDLLLLEYKWIKRWLNLVVCFSQQLKSTIIYVYIYANIDLETIILVILAMLP